MKEGRSDCVQGREGGGEEGGENQGLRERGSEGRREWGSEGREGVTRGGGEILRGNEKLEGVRGR